MRALILALVTMVGCARGQELPPIHEALACDGVAADGGPASERAAAFDRWAHAALRRPGSTFSVWAAGPGGRAELRFAACVPERWGANVMAVKAAFLRDGRVRAAEGGAPLQAGCTVPETPAVRLTLLTSDRTRALEPPREPHHLAVVCDRSDSMLGSSCGAPALEAAYDRWLVGSGAAEGSTFTVYGVGASRDAAVVLRRVVAAGSSTGERAARLLGVRALLGASLRGAPTGSALAEALDVAAADLGGRSGGKSVLILSDLRQVTPGTWNFEALVPEPAAFTAWLHRAGLLGGLRGLELQACGLHHRRAPGARRYDAPLAHRVEQAWTEALQAMGAGGAPLGGSCPLEQANAEGS